jgi:Ni/Co efflux regulator RcnB
MKRLLLAASIALALSPALAFASPSPAAQGQRWSQSRGHDDHDRRHDRYQHDRRPVHRHDNGRHEGWYKQSFRRGQRVPVVYLQPRYYVNDYRAYRLPPPPYGYRWVRPYGNDEYLLVQVATGLIMQVLGY